MAIMSVDHIVDGKVVVNSVPLADDLSPTKALVADPGGKFSFKAKNAKFYGFVTMTFIWLKSGTGKAGQTIDASAAAKSNAGTSLQTYKMFVMPSNDAKFTSETEDLLKTFYMDEDQQCNFFDLQKFVRIGWPKKFELNAEEMAGCQFSEDAMNKGLVLFEQAEKWIAMVAIYADPRKSAIMRMKGTWFRSDKSSGKLIQFDRTMQQDKYVYLNLDESICYRPPPNEYGTFTIPLLPSMVEASSLDTSLKPEEKKKVKLGSAFANMIVESADKVVGDKVAKAKKKLEEDAEIEVDAKMEKARKSLEAVGMLATNIDDKISKMKRDTMVKMKIKIDQDMVKAEGRIKEGKSITEATKGMKGNLNEVLKEETTGAVEKLIRGVNALAELSSATNDKWTKYKNDAITKAQEVLTKEEFNVFRQDFEEEARNEIMEKMGEAKKAGGNAQAAAEAVMEDFF
jgi:hypothetical protein